MRRFVRSLFLVTLLSLVCLTLAFAHPGKTDASGGHYDHSTGEYHYHHGYPAHQHIDGECPYDFDDQTGVNSGSPSTGSGSTQSPANRSPSPRSSSGSYSRTPVPSASEGQSSSLPADAFFAIITLAIVSGFMLMCSLGSSSKAKPKDPPKPPPPPARTICIPPSVKAPPPSPPERQKPVPVQKVVPRAPSRLDLSDRIAICYNGQSVTLYGVPSAFISHIGYVRDDRILFVRMSSLGRVYMYFDVPYSTCSAFVRSDSIGSFYNTHIKEKFHGTLFGFVPE